jgi:hypothetical protein
MRFKDRKMASRTGDVVLLEEVLERAVALARQTIERGAPERGRPVPRTPTSWRTASAWAPVVFNDLKNRRVRDVVFDWDEVLSFEGRTGPYLQYTAARIASLADKYGREPPARSSGRGSLARARPPCAWPSTRCPTASSPRWPRPSPRWSPTGCSTSRPASARSTPGATGPSSRTTAR